MRISLNWLAEYIDLDVGVTELCDRMTMLGLEIEAVERPGEGIDGVVVGEILSIEPHPEADRLVVCKTDVGGDEPLQIVCGATNMSVGDRVPTACIGAVLPGDFKVGKRKMRGIASQGMMCSAKELGLGEDHEGLLIMDPDQGAVGDDVRAILGLNDTVLEIEVTPNRNDWSGMLGIARELSAAYGAPVRIPDITLDEGDTPASELSSVTVEDTVLCPRYVGRIIRGVKVGPSPGWLAQRLIAVGQRPINNIVDVTNYVLLETGHPLHAFDLDRLKGERIVVRPARDGESIRVIDGTTHTLTPEALVIADAKVPIAIAGVMGGLDSEVGEETTSIFLESACFDPVSIRKTARAYNMITEASQRFQRGADIEMVRYAVDRAAALLVEVSGGELASGVLEAYERIRSIPEVTLRYDRCERLLGTGIPSEKQRTILTSLGFAVAREDEESVTVEVPS
ncbi:MAG: phenylalanine--tRNA ligase subunit beta, partial [Candidatus Hydrogenedentes bacterium]|nr:phenylalanine--tRNA ligase subunit beta [Candidatus Hydrogenedentota bacterium]